MYILHLVEYRDKNLKIASINNKNRNNVFNNVAHKKNQNPAFKASSLGMGILSASGALMQGIENKGYVASFLIQDSLGMTLPRTITGFYRDREVTGEYNVKEGREVLGREGMTGPFMMFMPIITTWLVSKLCRSASTNTRLIKIIGKNFKTMMQASKNIENIKNDKEALKKEFIRYNI